MPTDVATSLPQLDLRDSAVLTVTLSDPAAVITSLVLHAFQTLPSTVPDNPVPLLTLEPSSAGPGGS